MNIVVLPIRLGDVVPSQVDITCRTFYERIADVFFLMSESGQQISLECLRPLPIVSAHALQPLIIANQLIAEIKRAAHLDSGVLVDVGGPDERSLLKPTVVQALNEAILQLLNERSDLKVGIFIPIRLNSQDHSATALLQTLNTNMQVRCLFGDGSHWGRFFDARNVPSSEVRQWLEAARTDPIEILKNKIIRRVGHYSLPSASQTYINYYDGQEAKAEIFRVLRDKLQELQTEATINRVFYLTHSSKWFEGPVVHALQATGLAANARKINSIKPVNELRSPGCLLLLPIVRTGDTLRKLLRAKLKIKGTGYPRVWSLLSTDGPEDAKGTRPVKLHADDPPIQVEYCVLVRGVSKWAQNTINALEFSGIDPEKEDLAQPFTPSAMWSMILESGMIIEDEGGRVGRLGYVPNFEKLAAANGSFLAAKFIALLKKRFGSQLPDIVFLCPAERHAQKLADCLRDLAGFGTIRVKRPIIDLFASGKSLDDVKSDFSANAADRDIRLSFFQLSMLRNANEKLVSYEKPSVVLLDEFSFSGSTTRGLYRLSKAFGLDVLCQITLGDFNPRSVTDDLVERYPFYKIDYQLCMTPA